MSCDADHCITCGDDGVPMRVLRVDAARALALCEDGDGARARASRSRSSTPGVGDTLLVHAGTALTRLEATAA